MGITNAPQSEAPDQPVDVSDRPGHIFQRRRQPREEGRGLEGMRVDGLGEWAVETIAPKGRVFAPRGRHESCPR
jgi:hypothetical protein